MAVKSNSDTLVTVFGGSGFLGRHLVRALANRQYLVRVAVRRPELTGHLQPLGRVGQVSDVVDGILFLEASPYITGEILHIDGGQIAGH